MDYDYEIKLDSNSAAAHVVGMVGKNKKVLELGAGSGAVTRHLVNTNQCDVVAFEVNPDLSPSFNKFAGAFIRVI